MLVVVGFWWECCGVIGFGNIGCIGFVWCLVVVCVWCC